jgi:hypothetical protein
MPVQDLRDAAYPQESGEAAAYLVVIEHELLDEPIRLTDILQEGMWDDDLETWVIEVDSETYYWLPFEIVEPNASEDAPLGKIMMPNIDTRIGAAIESITGAANITITVVLRSDPTVLLADPFELMEIRNVRGDAMEVSADIAWPSLTKEPWPQDWMRPSKFGAAFRALS